MNRRRSRKISYQHKIDSSKLKRKKEFWSVRREFELNCAADFFDKCNTQELLDDVKFDCQDNCDYIKPVEGIPVYDENEKYW